MSASASPTTSQKPDPPEPMAPPEAGDTEGEQLFGTPLAASDAGAEPLKFDLTEEQDTQTGPTAESSAKGPDDDAGIEFTSMEVDYGTSEAQQNDGTEEQSVFPFSRSSLDRPEGEQVRRAIEATYAVDLEQDEVDPETEVDVRAEQEATGEESRPAHPPTTADDTQGRAPVPVGTALPPLPGR